MNTIRSKKTLESRLRSLIAGTKMHFPNAPPVTFGGQTFTSVALVQFLSDELNAMVAVSAATVALRDAVKAARAKQAVTGRWFGPTRSICSRSSATPRRRWRTSIWCPPSRERH